MLVYSRFFEILRQKKKSQYSLIYDDGISSSLLFLLRQNASPDPQKNLSRAIRTNTLAKLCTALNCMPQDIFEQDRTHDDQLRQFVQDIKEKENKTDMAD